MDHTPIKFNRLWLVFMLNFMAVISINNCPNRFGLYHGDNNSVTCFNMKPPETYDKKFDGCYGNQVNVFFYTKNHLMNIANRLIWTELVRDYEGGPYRDWSVSVLANVKYNLMGNTLNSTEAFMCSVFNRTYRDIIPARCDEEHVRLCIFSDEYRDIYNKNLPDTKISFKKRNDDSLIFVVSNDVPLENIKCINKSPLKNTGELKIFKTDTKMEFELHVTEDDYYYCFIKQNHFQVSEKVLFIKDKNKYLNGYAVMVSYSKILNNVLKMAYRENYTEIYEWYCYFGDCVQNCTENEARISSVLLESLELRIKRVYSERLLFHITKGIDVFMKYLNSYVIFKRKVLECETLDSIQNTDIGDVKVDMKNCKKYSCEGNFNIGAFWNITQIKDCNVAVLTPEEEIKDGLNIIEGALKDSVNTSSFKITAFTFDKLLSLGQNTIIPPKILRTFEKFVDKVIFSANESIEMNLPNMGIVIVGSTNDQPVIGIKVSSKLDISILTADSVIEDWENNSIVVNTSSLINPNESSRMSFIVFRDDRVFNPQIKTSHMVNKQVLSIQVKNNTQFIKNGYIDIHFHAIREKKKNERIICAFWDFDLGPFGKWSTKDCELMSTPEVVGMNTCRCKHLTHFAQLIINNNKNISEANYNILSIISLVGCVLSLLGLLCIGLTGILFQTWRRDLVHKMWLHLSAAMTVMVVTFLVISTFGFDSSDVTLCVISGVTLHYAVLSTFCWMFVVAIIYYQMTVNVFQSISSSDRMRIILANVFGWIFPAIPIAVLFAISTDSYSEKFMSNQYGYEFCYPSENKWWLAVFLPVSLIVFCNTLLFIYIVFSVYLSNLKKRNKKNKRLKQIKTLLILFYQFGLVWIFSLLSYYTFSAYLFCVLGSLQGVVLFYFFIAGNAKSRKLWLIKLKINPVQRVPGGKSTRHYTVSKKKCNHNDGKCFMCENATKESRETYTLTLSE